MRIIHGVLIFWLLLCLILSLWLLLFFLLFINVLLPLLHHISFVGLFDLMATLITSIFINDRLMCILATLNRIEELDQWHDGFLIHPTVILGWPALPRYKYLLAAIGESPFIQNRTDVEEIIDESISALRVSHPYSFAYLLPVLSRHLLVILTKN